MKKYWLGFKTSIQTFLQYRSNLILQLIGSIIFYVALTLLWIAIYQNQDIIGDYTKPEMITYILGSAIISGYIFYTAIGDYTDFWIRKGILSMWLIRPFSILFYWFVDDFARRIFSFLINFIALAMITGIFFTRFLVIQNNFNIIALVIFVVFLAGLINYLIFNAIALFAFWMDQTWGIRFVFRVIITIAAGTVIPLSFLTGPLGQLFNWLPFKYMSYIPMQIYLGKIATERIWIVILIELTWIFVLWLAVKFVWKTGIKHYTAVGG